jgi:release factor glutamine methyltransferase
MYSDTMRMSTSVTRLKPLLRTVEQALLWAGEELVGTSEAVLAARMLLAHVLDCTLAGLFAHPERALSGPQERAYRTLVARRAQYEPVAYLLGHRAFLDLDLLVDRRALIPRPETEELVELTAEVAGHWPSPRLADIGTGSGAIAIGLALRLPEARIWATDCSADALALAQRNAQRCGVSARITFPQGDLVAPLSEPVEVIVANLPYVNEAEFAALPPDIRLYEPREALVAGPDGLETIRALLGMAEPYLARDGVLLLEIGAGQGAAVATLARHAFPDARIDVIADDAHLDRIVHVQCG